MLPAVASSQPWPVGPDGAKVKPVESINIAFTAEGLSACGLPPEVLCTFPPEFQKGSHTRIDRKSWETRRKAPGHMGWRPGSRPLHAVMVVHADWRRDWRPRVSAAGLLTRRRAASWLSDGIQTGYRPESDCEPFGFHDGIAQPPIAGLSGAGVPTGEFIPSTRTTMGLSPHAGGARGVDPGAVLPPLVNPYRVTVRARPRNQRILSRDRKLQQDVGGFWCS